MNLKNKIKKFYSEENKQNIVIFIPVALILLIVIAFFMIGNVQEGSLSDENGESFESVGNTDKKNVHPLSGIECDRSDKRPFAVMLSSDQVARPTYGIAKADIVVEMPVLAGGVTRLMALFICETPEEIGSIRSSRHDFIPIADSFNAIYAHWGGSKYALDLLDKGVIDNIDGLPNPHNAYYRKVGKKAPHNGFTSFERLENSAKLLGYDVKYNGHAYEREKGESKLKEANTLSIRYGGSNIIDYKYNPNTNQYLRSRWKTPEVDGIDSTQAKADTIAVLFTRSSQLDHEYNDVDVSGGGELYIAQNGIITKGRWAKPATPNNSKIEFYDENNNEIPLVEGRLWIQYVNIGTPVYWAGGLL